MAFPTLTYTLTNGTNADASEVQQNFNDLLNGITDGSKDIKVNDAEIDGTIDVDGTLQLGSANSKLASDTIEFVGCLQPGWLNNLGISLSAGVFSIVDAGGTAISASNLGYVTVPSTTGGQMVTLAVTAGGTFNDDSNASSSLTDLGFGITETADWAEDMPFFLYVVNRANSEINGVDGNSAFFLARSPSLYTTPSSADDIGDNATIPVNDSQDVILIMDNVTVANYTSLPCQLIGSIRMQWSTTTDDWTVQTLGNSDGLGKEQLEKQFSRWWTMPAGQNGADSGAYFRANSGTPPVFTTNQIYYQVLKNGNVRLQFFFDGDGGQDGSGAVNFRLALPVFMSSSTPDRLVLGAAFKNNASGASSIYVLPYLPPTATDKDYIEFLEDDGNVAHNGDFSSGSRRVASEFTYRAF